MNAKQTNKDKIYVHSSFKQFLFPCLRVFSAVAIYNLALRRKKQMKIR